MCQQHKDHVECGETSLDLRQQGVVGTGARAHDPWGWGQAPHSICQASQQHHGPRVVKSAALSKEMEIKSEFCVKFLVVSRWLHSKKQNTDQGKQNMSPGQLRGHQKSTSTKKPPCNAAGILGSQALCPGVLGEVGICLSTGVEERGSSSPGRQVP